MQCGACARVGTNTAGVLAHSPDCPNDTNKKSGPLYAKHLKLGDVVQTMKFGPYRDATVKRIDLPGVDTLTREGEVHLVRPYVQSMDYSYTGGVITYIGYEEYAIPFGYAVNLIQRKTPEVK